MAVSRVPEPPPREPGHLVSGPGGWRPGARWAQAEVGSADWLERQIAKKRAKKAALQAQIETLPAHQRPPMRELGRRSEAAPVPFRAMPADEVGGRLERGLGHAPIHPLPLVSNGWGAMESEDPAGLTAPAKGCRIPDRVTSPPHPSFVRAQPVEARGPDETTATRPSTAIRTNGEKHRENRFPLPDPGGAGAGSAGPKQAAAHAEAGTRVRYDLQGAFWHTGRTLAGNVRRATGEAKPPPPPPPPEPLPPLVTAERQGQRMVIAAACSAARAIGLAPGAAISLARATVPGLDVRPADRGGDAAFLRRLALFAARRWTPIVAVDADGLWLDLTGVAHLHGGEARFCARVVRFLGRMGIAARVAIADTAGAAHALARHGGEAIAICPPGGHEDAIAPLPVAALRMEDATCDALRRLGIERVADLAALPRGPLVRRFGAETMRRLDQATGRTAEPVDAVGLPQPPRAELRLIEPIATAEAIGQVIGDLCDRLAAALADRGLGARRLLLAARRVDGEDQPVAIGTARPTRDGRHLADLLRRRIEIIDPGFGIEAMALVAWRTEPLGPQAIAGDLAGAPPTPDLAPLVDKLVGRLGPRRLYRMAAVESDVPERSVVRIGALEEGGGWPPDWPRPARLINPPERIEHVIAELPDQPPRRFTWRGEAHRVVAGDGPERVFGEWWRRTGEADAVRDYFRVEDEAGRRFWLYRRGDGVDGRTGDLSWHLQGLFG